MKRHHDHNNSIIVLIGGWLTVSEVYHHGEGIRQQAWYRRSHWEPLPDLQEERDRHWVWCALLKPQTSDPEMHFLQQGAHLLILLIISNSSIAWWRSIQIQETRSHSYRNQHRILSIQIFPQTFGCSFLYYFTEEWLMHWTQVLHPFYVLQIFFSQ